MIDIPGTKQAIYSSIMSIINDRIENSRAAIALILESRNNETKSSAGDKYETGRAMMQMEQEKNEFQLSQSLYLKAVLAQINLEKEYANACLGSLVITDQGKYFISIGVGKIDVKGKVFYAISLDSPIGKLLSGKRKGDGYIFNEKKVDILEIY